LQGLLPAIAEETMTTIKEKPPVPVYRIEGMDDPSELAERLMDGFSDEECAINLPDGSQVKFQTQRERFHFAEGLRYPKAGGGGGSVADWVDRWLTQQLCSPDDKFNLEEIAEERKEFWDKLSEPQRQQAAAIAKKVREFLGK
jgi:hypothetical protein